jgi:hypothetical protein
MRVPHFIACWWLLDGLWEAKETVFELLNRWLIDDNRRDQFGHFGAFGNF